MDEYGWGLTSAGFRRPTYNELLDALEHKARELFGATANLTVRSPLGLFLRIFAWILNILFSVLEDVYNSRFVDTAVGTSLLNLGRAIGLRVLSAQKASGYIMVTGPPGVIVPAGWLVETAAGIQFFAVSDTEIGAEGTVMVPFRCTSTGPDGNVAADTITTITNPGSVAGITAVTNPAAFTGGRERETDEEFRDRYYASVDYAGGVNADSIRAALLQNVDGIMEARYLKMILTMWMTTVCRRTASKLLFTAVWTVTLRRSFTKNWVPAYRRPARKWLRSSPLPVQQRRFTSTGRIRYLSM